LIAACIPETTENPDALLRINDRRGDPLGRRVAGSHVLPCPGLAAQLPKEKQPRADPSTARL
jgi:hypothetical protein